MKLKKDKRNYRVHDERNQQIIGRSLDECGAGRSIVADAKGNIIAGNGVYEQAAKRGIKIKTVETDGSELVVVVRKDMAPDDPRRKKLALADNAASDTSSWNAALLQEDWGQQEAGEWGIPAGVWNNTPAAFDGGSGDDGGADAETNNLPPELQGAGSLEPAELPKIEGDFETQSGRVMITFPRGQEDEVARLLGLSSLDKVIYTLEELLNG